MSNVNRRVNLNECDVFYFTAARLIALSYAVIITTFISLSVLSAGAYQMFLRTEVRYIESAQHYSGNRWDEEAYEEYYESLEKIEDYGSSGNLQHFVVYGNKFLRLIVYSICFVVFCIDLYWILRRFTVFSAAVLLGRVRIIF